jgi:hypothetical protein
MRPPEDQQCRPLAITMLWDGWAGLNRQAERMANFEGTLNDVSGRRAATGLRDPRADVCFAPDHARKQTGSFRLGSAEGSHSAFGQLWSFDSAQPSVREGSNWASKAALVVG